MPEELKRFDMRADPETLRLLEALGRKWGIGRSAAMRYAVRRAAEADGVIEAQSKPPEALELRRGPKPQRLSENGAE